MSFEQALRVQSLANPKERQEIAQIIATKRANAAKIPPYSFQ